MVRAQGTQFGDYRLVRLLGEGGFAEVYEAEHVHLPGMKAAIKLLKGSFTPQQIEKLRQEALMVGKLDHPHIVQLRTFSIDEHGTPYLVMAYAQGGTLHEKHPRGTPIALSEILVYVRSVAAALQYAHEQRIIHRDLKPANLLLTQDGRVQVADFGIAVVSHNSRSRTMQEVAGTWKYMAPEQFRGQAGAASDQYSMAIMVYQWLCGNVPFDGNGNMYLIPRQHEKEAPPSLRVKLPDLLPCIEDALMRALAKDPKYRFASIQEFADALEEASKPPFVPAPRQRLGNYQLVRKLGEGGFAEVYEAKHLHVGTRAAIKLLKGTFTPAQVEGLRKEASVVMQLDHPHIIRAYDFSIERKIPYLIIAYAPGGSLATRHEQGTPLPLETIREYVRQIADALQYAHDRKITHCDIKPENILLTQDGRLQVADFGIAIMAQKAQAAQEIVGSWTYMAPEQFEGRAEPASDQYALGIMVYQWLCGEPPFTGNGSIYALPYQHMNEPPPPLRGRIPTISSRIEQVVMKSLAKQPGERFASVSAFAQAFEEACTEPPTYTTLLTYEHLRGDVNAVAWSPDGTRVASGGADATVRIWEPATGQTLFTFRGHTSYVKAVRWSPDGSLLASASYGDVQVWEVGSGKLLQRYGGHTTHIYAAEWSPDGSLLASVSDDKSVQVWEAESGRLVRRYDGHTEYVNAVGWSPDGRLLASASGDKSVRVWEVGSGKLLQRYEGQASIYNAVGWSPDGRLLASISGDKSVQVWEAGSGRLVRKYEGHHGSVRAVGWSPDGSLLASASYGGDVQVWEAGSGKLVRKYGGHTSSVSAVEWSPNGSLLALASYGDVQVWEVGSGKLVQRYEGHASFVNGVGWSPNGNMLASGSGGWGYSDNVVQVWEVGSEKLVREYEGHTSSVNAVGWSPDGSLLASASSDGTVQVWEVGSGKLVRRYESHTRYVNAVGWSPDGRLLAAGSGDWKGLDNIVQVWEVGSGKLVRKCEGHSSSVNAVEWSPDGSLLASASDDNTVQVWEAESGRLVRRYKGHTASVRAVGWSPDGSLLASGSDDNTVQVWEVSTGKVLLTYREHFMAVRDVAWSPDGERIASASNEVRVWVAR